MVLNSLGGVLQRLGRFEDAAAALQRSMAISEELKDQRSLAMVLNSLGGILQRLGRFEDAAVALQRSMAISEELKDQRSLAMVLNSLGGVLQRLGRFEDAVDALQRSYELLVDQKDERGQAMVLNSLGGVLQRLGKTSEADKAFYSSIAIGKKLDDNGHLAKVRTAFGKTLLFRGELEAAIENLYEGFRLDENARNKRGLGIVTPVLIDTLKRLGRDVESTDIIARALAIAPHERSIQMLAQPPNEQDKNANLQTTVVTGRIKRLLAPMGHTRFGFIVSDDNGKEAYFSERRIGNELFSQLKEGTHVEADMAETTRGREAYAIRFLLGDDDGA
jgi:tetratricopeptide (TPR) repeat protein